MSAIGGQKLALACFCDQGQKENLEGNNVEMFQTLVILFFFSIKLRLQGTDAAFLIEVI